METETNPDEFEKIVEEMQLDDTKIEFDDPLEADLIDENTFGDLIPNMNLNQQQDEAANEPCIIEDKVLLDIYDEILSNCRKDRETIDDTLVKFEDMVFNEGEASSAAKEALVNLIKIKSETSDKMSKVADLMTRLKLKSKDTFPRFLSATQNNNVRIENNSKRDLIKKIEERKNAK